MVKIIGIVVGAILGAALLATAGPIVGEIIATLPPLFLHKEMNPLSRLGLSYEDVAFRSSDGLTLRGWFIPADEPSAPAIIYAPGTGQDQTAGLHIVKPLHDAHYHVLLFSYRGSGNSDGSELSFTYGETESLDLDAAVAFLAEVKHVERIGVIGFSAGAATAILSAARNPRIATVVAAASFTTVSEVWDANIPAFMPRAVVDWFMRLAELRKGFRRENIRPVAAVRSIAPRPLLLIHGEADSRISLSQARQLFAAAGSPRELWIVQGATHHMIYKRALVSLAPNIIMFLDQALRQSQPTYYVASQKELHKLPGGAPAFSPAAAAW